jgi:hypothetical protein
MAKKFAVRTITPKTPLAVRQSESSPILIFLDIDRLSGPA